MAQQNVPSINFSLPLHFYIADSKGKALVVEYVKGKRYEYDNTIGALTNAPPFDWHLNNLSNYVNLSPLNVPKFLDREDDRIQSIGQGSGLLGIPGDYTPPSRFVRAALFSQWATSPKTAEETARLGFHILNTFDIFFGIIREKTDESGHRMLSQLRSLLTRDHKNEVKDSEYTQWTVVHDRKNLKTYFRSYDSLHIQMVDMKKIDLSEPGFKEIKMQDRFVVDDVTAKVQPLKS